MNLSLNFIFTIRIQNALDKSIRTYENLIFVSLGMILLGLFKMSAVMSIGMGLFAIANIWYVFHIEGKFNFNASYVLLIAVIFWMGISYFWSDNTAYYLERMRVKLPLLLCPLLCLYAPKFGFEFLKKVTLLFSVILSIAGVYVLYNYINNYESIHQNLVYGTPIPVPCYSHIRFSLMYVLGFILNLVVYLFDQKKYWNLVFCIFFFAFVHIMAVRSAWVCIYISLFIIIAYIHLLNKTYFKGLILLIGTILVCFFLMRQIPSIRNKLGYMSWDMEQFFNNSKRGTSDAARLNSIIDGLAVARESGWNGTGEGDLQDVMSEKFKSHHYTDVENFLKMPHNQFVWTYASTGIVGLILLCAFFIFSLFNAIRYRQIFLIVFLPVAIFTMLFEQTFETQLGVTFFIFPYFLFNQLSWQPSVQ